MNIPQNVSESTRKRNPHLYKFSDEQIIGAVADALKTAIEPRKPKRLRQSTKPILNKLEQEVFDQLTLTKMAVGDGMPIHKQAITFKLANGLRYTPDLYAFSWTNLSEGARPTAWEVKGPWATDDSIAKVKMFAAAYPEIRVLLVWKDDNKRWQQQRILP